MPQTARDLVAYKAYTPTGTTDIRQTRKLTLDQEWLFGGAGGSNILLKFGSNFFKKHLFTYSKKTAEVAQIAHNLSEVEKRGKAEPWTVSPPDVLFFRSTNIIMRVYYGYACLHGRDAHVQFWRSA